MVWAKGVRAITSVVRVVLLASKLALLLCRRDDAMCPEVEP